MITYIEYTDYSLLLQFVCKELKLENDFEHTLLSGKINGVQKIKLNNVFEIENYLTAQDSFFDEPDQNNHLLIDLQTIDISKHGEYFSNAAAEFKGQIYIYSTENDSINADTKKTLKKYKIEVETLKKINPNIAMELYSKYADEIKLNISSSQVKTLVDQTLGYNEIIDNLDFISMAGNAKKGYEALLKTQKPMLFMQGFNLSNLDTSLWYKNVDENELQLALSLIFGKLDKTDIAEAKYLQQEIINTDQKIKTSSKLPSLTWFRLFLFKAKNL
jgi:hypothetical protein